MSLRLLFPLPLVPLLLFLVPSVERKAFGTQQGQNSPCAELQQSHSQPAEFEANFGGHFKKNWQNLELFECKLWRRGKKDVQKMPCSISQGMGDDQEVLQFLRLTFLCSHVGPVPAVPVQLSAHRMFYGAAIVFLGSWGCNFRLFPQYIQYVSSQWISVKEISCSYRMLLDNINTWELLCKIRFRLPGLRVVSCKVFFSEMLNFLVCSRWMVSIDFRQRYFHWPYIMQEPCLKKSKYFLLCMVMEVLNPSKQGLLQVFSGTFIYMK